MATPHRRSVMALYSGFDDIDSHFARIVLSEKGVNVEIIEMDPLEPSEELKSVNHYGILPTLVDRELVLYDAKIIAEYLDERFPHPPMLPVYPVMRARSRQILHRIESDWYSLYHRIRKGDEDQEECQEELVESLIKILPIFSDTEFFFSEEFSVLDCALAPLLWRLTPLGVQLPSNARPIWNYAKRIFERDTFQASLTLREQEIPQNWWSK